MTFCHKYPACCCSWGEPFLNPDLIKMISYAKARGIVVHTSTNGNVPLDEARVEALVDSGLDSLVVAVDGAGQETYEKYRQGGRLDRVILNIQHILRVRSSKGSETPRINMRFVVMRHNEADIPAVCALASELGVDFFTLKTMNIPSETSAEWEPLTPGKAKRPGTSGESLIWGSMTSGCVVTVPLRTASSMIARWPGSRSPVENHDGAGRGCWG